MRGSTSHGLLVQIKYFGHGPIGRLLRCRHLPGAVRLAERLANGLLDAADAFNGRRPEWFC